MKKIYLTLKIFVVYINKLVFFWEGQINLIWYSLNSFKKKMFKYIYDHNIVVWCAKIFVKIPKPIIQFQLLIISHFKNIITQLPHLIFHDILLNQIYKLFFFFVMFYGLTSLKSNTFFFFTKIVISLIKISNFNSYYWTTNDTIFILKLENDIKPLIQ